uniref:Uncharacterized protein n=1 Tax=Rhizophora mucronata TaxID=61149 RepID=A0A2P2Q7Z4_RHIMU
MNILRTSASPRHASTCLVANSFIPSDISTQNFLSPVLSHTPQCVELMH